MHDERGIEETLRVIRRLMERGERYEAVTGKGALIAGVAALAVGGIVHWVAGTTPRYEGVADRWFVGAWLLLAVGCAASVMLTALRGSWRTGAEPDEPPARLSAQARAVSRAVLPAWLVALAFTVAAMGLSLSALLPAAWMSLHGVAILATSYHAPRRLIGLGWAFLVAGSLQFAWMCWAKPLPPNLAMVLGFGGINLAYGLLAVLRPDHEND